MTEKKIKQKAWHVKHRPTKFADVIGHSAVVKVLKQMVAEADEKLPNAIMFVGGSGRGKTTLSRMFSRYLNCETGDACGKCKSCQMMDVDSHPDYAEINSADARGINEMRAVLEKARFKPRSNVRIVYLDECHMMTKEAANLLLKPLEEPPADTIFILATTDPEKIPNFQAIKGRCAIMYLSEPSIEDINSRLAQIAKAEKFDKFFNDKHYTKMSQTSGGHVRDAVTLLESACRTIKLSGKSKLKPASVSKIVNDVCVDMNVDDVELEAIAMKCLIGAYTGNLSMIISSSADTKEYVGLIMKMIYLNKYVMNIKAGAEGKYVWHTPANRKFHEYLKKNAPEALKSLIKMVKLHSTLLQLRGEVVSTPGVDGSDLIISRLGITSLPSKG